MDINPDPSRQFAKLEVALYRREWEFLYKLVMEAVAKDRVLSEVYIRMISVMAAGLKQGQSAQPIEAKAFDLGEKRSIGYYLKRVLMKGKL